MCCLPSVVHVISSGHMCVNILLCADKHKTGDCILASIIHTLWHVSVRYITKPCRNIWEAMQIVCIIHGIYLFFSFLQRNNLIQISRKKNWNRRLELFSEGFVSGWISPNYTDKVFVVKHTLGLSLVFFVLFCSVFLMMKMYVYNTYNQAFGQEVFLRDAKLETV